VAVAGGLTFSSVSSGAVHTCALTAGGAAYCWGDNSKGQVGSNSTANTFVAPVAVAGGLIFTSIGIGDYHTCGVTTTGAAYCWGWNPTGQLGNNSTTNSLVPVAVAGGLTFSSVSGGFNHTSGLTPGGAAYSWGAPGTLGNNTFAESDIPVPVVGGLTFRSLSGAGGSTNCGLTTGGVVYCWGSNFQGALGIGTTAGISLVPVKVAYQP
jgi:alpha-tubulin suppressor-like RCC1 family protein